MSGNQNKIIAFNYFGGKFTWLDELYQYFPEHVHFVDVFCGSMSVTLNKKRSELDTANDINSDVYTFFKVLRNRPKKLIESILLTPVSREEYNNCYYNQGKIISDLERARMFYVRARQSFYSLGAQRVNKGWHAAKTKAGAKYGETVSKWINSVDKLVEIINRLSTIQIENQCFRDLIPKMDFGGVFFYCDPPYPIESRTGKNDYKYDFTDNDHIDLAELLNKAKGKVMLSSYDCPLIQDLYPSDKWSQIKFDPKKNNIRSSIVQECIWINYEPPFRQLNLFST